ncbi:MAG TPA: ATP-binding cassette domain-containing protein, partial [Armatimonadota bacterium]|nr:ATP-binding cassette domain-containing protein [Armatimonadota bacterium]
MNGVTKRFPGVLALADVNLSLYQGEILGLIGENGAGKSTLMNILGGIYAPDTGEVLIEGQPVKLGSVQDALAHGVAIIHQELNLAGNLDVASNIFLGREPADKFSVVKRKKLYDEAAVFARMVGLTAPLNAVVEDLPSAQQQLVEIAKAISQSAKILVLDEPTSSLSDKETQKLFSVMRMLKEKG